MLMINNIRTYLSVILIIIISGCVTKIESIKTDTVRVLDEEMGYLFITISSNASFTKFAISGQKNIALTKPDFHNNVNYYLVPVPAGQYQIKQFGMKYGGKYKFNRKHDDELWGFEVKPGVISYVGELRVRRLLYIFSTFELINNSSQALEYLEGKYPNVLAKRTIEYHGPGSDSFFDLFDFNPKINNPSKQAENNL